MKALARLRAALIFPIGFAFAMLASAQPDDAWRSLCNGRDFTGWTLVDPPIDATVQDGAMVIHMTPHTARHAFIRTNETFRDFIFEIEFQRDQAMDSGVLFRSEDAPDSAFSGLFGYMVKLDPQAQRRWTGGIFVDYGNGYNWLHSLAHDLQAQAAEKSAPAWNLLRIEAISDIITVWLNGVPTAHLRDDRYTEGYIALKIHYMNTGDPAQQARTLRYRHARVITAQPARFATPSPLPLIDARDDHENTYFR
jgi:hypothetical protein